VSACSKEASRAVAEHPKGSTHGTGSDSFFIQKVCVHMSPRGDDPAPTRRERQILDLVAEGRSDKEIVAELGMAHATLRTHISRLFARFTVVSRGQLAARWTRNRR
jgi:DNA-binding CsgD family transcriptional regulator